MTQQKESHVQRMKKLFEENISHQARTKGAVKAIGEKDICTQKSFYLCPDPNALPIKKHEEISIKFKSESFEIIKTDTTTFEPKKDGENDHNQIKSKINMLDHQRSPFNRIYQLKNFMFDDKNNIETNNAGDDRPKYKFYSQTIKKTNEPYKVKKEEEIGNSQINFYQFLHSAQKHKHVKTLSEQRNSPAIHDLVNKSTDTKTVDVNKTSDYFNTKKPHEYSHNLISCKIKSKDMKTNTSCHQRSSNSSKVLSYYRNLYYKHKNLLSNLKLNLLKRSSKSIYLILQPTKTFCIGKPILQKQHRIQKSPSTNVFNQKTGSYSLYKTSTGPFKGFNKLSLYKSMQNMQQELVIKTYQFFNHSIKKIETIASQTMILNKYQNNLLRLASSRCILIPEPIKKYFQENNGFVVYDLVLSKKTRHDETKSPFGITLYNNMFSRPKNSNFCRFYNLSLNKAAVFIKIEGEDAIIVLLRNECAGPITNLKSYHLKVLRKNPYADSVYSTSFIDSENFSDPSISFCNTDLAEVEIAQEIETTHDAIKVPKFEITNESQVHSTNLQNNFFNCSDEIFKDLETNNPFEAEKLLCKHNNLEYKSSRFDPLCQKTSSKPSYHDLNSNQKELLVNFSVNKLGKSRKIGIFKKTFQKLKRLFCKSKKQDISPNNKINLEVVKIIAYIKYFGVHKEGIFRHSGKKECFSEIPHLLQNGKIKAEELILKYTLRDLAIIIKGYVNNIMQGLFSKKASKYLLQVQGNHKSPKAIVQDILHFCMNDESRLFIQYLFSLWDAICGVETNKMHPKALAVCFGPTLINCDALKDLSQLHSIVELVLHLYSLDDWNSIESTIFKKFLIKISCK